LGQNQLVSRVEMGRGRDGGGGLGPSPTGSRLALTPSTLAKIFYYIYLFGVSMFKESDNIKCKHI